MSTGVVTVNAAPAPLTMTGLKKNDALPAVTEVPGPMSSNAEVADEPLVSVPKVNVPPLRPTLPIAVKLAASPGPVTAR